MSNRCFSSNVEKIFFYSEAFKQEIVREIEEGVNGKLKWYFLAVESGTNFSAFSGAL